MDKALIFMGNLSNIGRIFYGIAIAAMGFQTVYYNDFPYMLMPPNHVWMNGVTYIFGTVLFLAGACIVFDKRTVPISLLLGSLLLLIFCFYFIPYEFIATSNYMHFGEWENAEKELALSGGAFVIAGHFSKQNENPLMRKLIPFGAIFFPVTVLCFGIDHFLYAKDAAGYIPSWIPNHIFWMYFTGSALIGSSLAIILGIKCRLAATLLGVMIFIWVLILHTPKVIVASSADRAGEVTSAFLALAYCGIAFVIAGL
jgi:hypothetical protein